ncbi:unnamed protein product [Ambrosiozyma monospora]|uniref:Small ribosomal subunit protein uS10m n=1 Tax=Ambrosiozyma monospora TaxID=43982 RepID=A0A9W6YYS8_AMBMO|nr:unnamed protein product [Ambrosiozyma monospora]
MLRLPFNNQVRLAVRASTSAARQARFFSSTIISRQEPVDKSAPKEPIKKVEEPVKKAEPIKKEAEPVKKTEAAPTEPVKKAEPIKKEAEPVKQTEAAPAEPVKKEEATPKTEQPQKESPKSKSAEPVKNSSPLEQAQEKKSPLKLSARLEKELEKLANIKLSTESIPSVEPDREAKAALLNTFKQYNPKLTTEETEVPGLDKPLPINTELNYYAPLKHKIKHHHLKAEVTFKCFDTRNLEFFSDFALRAAYYLGLPATGPTPLPCRRERWTVNRAPFVMAKSKENFERRTYGRKIRIYDANLEVVDLWLGYLKKNSVWGVGVKANLYKQEPLSVTSDMNKFSDGESTLSDVTASLDALTKENSSSQV